MMQGDVEDKGAVQGKIEEKENEKDSLDDERESEPFEQTFFASGNFDQSERKRETKARSKLPWAD